MDKCVIIIKRIYKGEMLFMAKLECELKGDFDNILESIDEAVMGKSISATKEDESLFKSGNSTCAVRIYERYSTLGGNRVSLSLTLFSSEGRIFLSVITSGGSAGVFFKVNTFGEEAFLDTISDVVEEFRVDTK